MNSKEYLMGFLDRSRAAQQQLEAYSQRQIDQIVCAMAKTVWDNAEALARLAVDETGMGVYAHKVLKNRGKARIIWNHLKDKRSIGILRELTQDGLVEVAKPMGVIAAVTPCTNPIVTPMCNGMFAVKGGNSVIIAPHPRAVRCAQRLKTLYDVLLEDFGAPKDLFLVMEDPSVERTTMLMRMADVVIATGGMGMVKAAYSSGRPSFGVGSGNVQGLYDMDINIPASVQRAVDSRTFDNGIICSGDQTLIAPRETFSQIIRAFQSRGAYYIDDPAKVAKFRDAVFPNGAMNKRLVGQSAPDIARAAGVSVPGDTRLILVRPEGYGCEDLLSREKMCPLMSVYVYDTWAQAIEIAKANLLVEGVGHSVSIQSDNRAHIEQAALALQVSRVLVNQSCATMNGGAFSNSLSPTTTLGCGSWGNNSISENLSYHHLFNVARIAFEKPSWSQPSDDEIWGEHIETDGIPSARGVCSGGHCDDAGYSALQ